MSRPHHHRVVREDLTTSVARLLRTSILDGSYASGDLLPPERELAGQFGVDRNTLRAALQELEQLGLVERRQGSGCRVLDYRETATLDLLKYLVVQPGTDQIDPDTAQSALDISLITLKGIVELVVERAVPDDHAALRVAVEQLGAAVANADVTEVIAAERRLVRLIVRAAHSIAAELVLNTYDQTYDAAFDPTGRLRLLWAQGFIDGDRMDQYREVVDAIERRDTAAARTILDVVLPQIPFGVTTEVERR